MDPQYIINGITLGSIIALGSIGLTLTYGILRLSNFAHGDLMTFGAFITWAVNQFFHVNIWLATIVGAIATVILALATEFLIWQPMRRKRANSTTLIIISIGLALVIRNAIVFAAGSGNQKYDLPVSEPIDFLGVKIKFYAIIVLALAATAIAALHFLLQNTKIGKAMRAVADDIDLARVTGINVERVVLWTWVITAILTSIAGSTYGLLQAVHPNIGWNLILPMFASVILGGIGNPYGAIAGATIVGIAQEIAVPIVGGEYKLAVALLIMVVTLLFRPQGLFKGTA
jgi:neutral amino acid transport system permease protein